MSFRGKLATTLLKTVQQVINKDIDIKRIQNRYHADKGRILRLYLTDIKQHANFKIENGKVSMIHCDNPNAEIQLNLDCLINLIDGKIKVKEQDGTVYMDDYTPFDAWRRGELMIRAEESESWLSDLTLLNSEIYREAFPSIRAKLGK